MNVKRTTILADEELLLLVKQLAREEGRSVTALVHEALRDYVKQHQPPRKISIAGIARLNQPWTADSLNEMLAEDIEPTEGWSAREAQPAPKKSRISS
jgi:hypothetical protein